jgi:hypothetical protein
MLLSKTIDGALRLIGVLAAGEEASSSEHNDALDRFNGMIDSFNIQNFTVSHLQEKVYHPPSVGWTSKITIGSDLTNTFVEVAPVSVQSAFFRDAAGVDFKMSPMGINEWSDMIWKNIVAPPLKYYENYYGHNLALQFDVVPYASYTLHLICKLPYAGNYKPTDNIDWDYGFEEMLRYQLAVRLAAEYGVQIRQDVVILAESLMKNIKTKNISSKTLNVDIGLRQSNNRMGYYDIVSGVTR